MLSNQLACGINGLDLANLISSYSDSDSRLLRGSLIY